MLKANKSKKNWNVAFRERISTSSGSSHPLKGYSKNKRHRSGVTTLGFSKKKKNRLSPDKIPDLWVSENELGSNQKMKFYAKNGNNNDYTELTEEDLDKIMSIYKVSNIRDKFVKDQNEQMVSNAGKQRILKEEDDEVKKRRLKKGEDSDEEEDKKFKRQRRTRKALQLEKDKQKLLEKLKLQQNTMKTLTRKPTPPPVVEYCDENDKCTRFPTIQKMLAFLGFGKK